LVNLADSVDDHNNIVIAIADIAAFERAASQTSESQHERYISNFNDVVWIHTADRRELVLKAKATDALHIQSDTAQKSLIRNCECFQCHRSVPLHAVATPSPSIPCTVMVQYLLNKVEVLTIEPLWTGPLCLGSTTSVSVALWPLSTLPSVPLELSEAESCQVVGLLLTRDLCCTDFLTDDVFSCRASTGDEGGNVYNMLLCQLAELGVCLLVKFECRSQQCNNESNGTKNCYILSCLSIMEGLLRQASADLVERVVPSQPSTQWLIPTSLWGDKLATDPFAHLVSTGRHNHLEAAGPGQGFPKSQLRKRDLAITWPLIHSLASQGVGSLRTIGNPRGLVGKNLREDPAMKAKLDAALEKAGFKPELMANKHHTNDEDTLGSIVQSYAQLVANLAGNMNDLDAALQTATEKLTANGCASPASRLFQHVKDKILVSAAHIKEKYNDSQNDQKVWELQLQIILRFQLAKLANNDATALNISDLCGLLTVLQMAFDKCGGSFVDFLHNQLHKLYGQQFRSIICDIYEEYEVELPTENGVDNEGLEDDASLSDIDESNGSPLLLKRPNFNHQKLSSLNDQRKVKEKRKLKFKEVRRTSGDKRAKIESHARRPGIESNSISPIISEFCVKETPMKKSSRRVARIANDIVVPESPF